MIRLTILILFAAFPSFTCPKCPTDDSNSGWNSDYSTLYYTSVSAIYRVIPSSVCPPINNMKMPGGWANLYLSHTSCLGYLGPLGPQGPLGALSPVEKNNFWNPLMSIMADIGDWSDLSEKLTTKGGPLSQNGPLGHQGPVSPSQYFGKAQPGKFLFESNDFAVQTRALGLWGALGPVGPLGALGPLGPFGPIGATGFAADSYGNYLSNGNVVREIPVRFDAKTVRTYELYENYEENFAKCIEDQDTSFMVEGSADNLDEIDIYPINSRENQIVTIVVTPVNELDQYDLAVYDAKGEMVGSSETHGYVETMQLMVSAGTRLYVAVKLTSSLHGLKKEYNLFVTGSTQELNAYNIQGEHVLRWYDNRYAEGTFPKKMPKRPSC